MKFPKEIKVSLEELIVVEEAERASLETLTSLLEMTNQGRVTPITVEDIDLNIERLRSLGVLE
jgi:hypothetical protein